MNMHVYGQVEWHTALMTDCVKYYIRAVRQSGVNMLKASIRLAGFNTVSIIAVYESIQAPALAAAGGEAGAMLCIKVGVRFALHHFESY